MDCPRELDLLIRARYPIIYLRTQRGVPRLQLDREHRPGREEEPGRVEQHGRAPQDRGLPGRRAPGISNRVASSAGDATRQPVAALEAILQYAGRAIYLMKDIHSYLDDRTVVRKIRDLYASLKRSYKTIVILAPCKKIPLDLEKDIYFLDMPLPVLDQLKNLLNDTAETLKGDPRLHIEMTATVLDRMANAALGLTLEEAERVFFKVPVPGAMPGSQPLRGDSRWSTGLERARVPGKHHAEKC